MERALILLAAALLVYMAPGIQGTSHLSFANATISPVNITRDGCAVTKLCVETPDNCDPTGNSSCLFASVMAAPAMAPNGARLSIELRGDSMGYIALGLTMDASMGTTMLFVCTQNISINPLFFRTMDRNNTDMTLTPIERNVTEIRGKVMGNVIMCEFDILNANASDPELRVSADTTFTVLLGSGPLNGDALGPFNITLTSRPLDLSDPTSNMVNTTATPTTESSGILSAYPHAVLPLLSILSMVIVLKA